jgi:malate synthase
VSNGRFALNAANARWGSLYDALYGTDALEPPTGGKGYDPVRGGKVVAFARAFLDRAAPLAAGSHADAAAYVVSEGAVSVRLSNGQTVGLATRPAGGWLARPRPPKRAPEAQRLHLEILIDRTTRSARTDAAAWPMCWSKRR